MKKALLPALMITCCLLAACDSTGADDETVAKGAFIAHVTGAASADLQGEGTFSTAVLGDTTFLELRLKAGEFPMPGRPDTLTMAYGVFLSVPWTGQTGTFNPAQNPMRWSNYVIPGAFSLMWWVQSGTVTLEQVSEDEIRGTLDLEAAANPMGVAISVTGSFSALSSDQPRPDSF